MSVILDTLIEKPDSYQVAYIKKVLNKIKTYDDGLAAAAVAASMNRTTTGDKEAYQNLYSLNKVNILCHLKEIVKSQFLIVVFSYYTKI